MKKRYDAKWNGFKNLWGSLVGESLGMFGNDIEDPDVLGPACASRDVDCEHLAGPGEPHWRVPLKVRKAFEGDPVVDAICDY